jgi:hypothetical protein
VRSLSGVKPLGKADQFILVIHFASGFFFGVATPSIGTRDVRERTVDQLCDRRELEVAVSITLHHTEALIATKVPPSGLRPGKRTRCQVDYRH